MGAPSIKRVQDLKGKIIGTTGPGGTTELAASMVLQNHGMDPRKDVTFMNIGGAETSVVAMRNGTIHARAFNPDAAVLLKKQASTARVLADMGPWPWSGYSTSDAHLANRRDRLRRWMRAMVKSP
jgi:ABC-type nitrate/sulfonate/bicarbonate transport system substrate-binding protein